MQVAKPVSSPALPAELLGRVDISTRAGYDTVGDTCETWVDRIWMGSLMMTDSCVPDQNDPRFDRILILWYASTCLSEDRDHENISD
jgi:hypothetical protein